ncbi:hypothetical protein NQ318_003662 [Aromia moschata]|uniref:BESS domain-containing protein n=1 Tax=Aromia moschata TaxID=1265417 RepID=A0AAV8Y2J8_9CUCU|nr:hypothetical protein NQ318_003662 [Aromia moschata]
MVEKQKTKEREFIVDCIHLYRELPALWNICHFRQISPESPFPWFLANVCFISRHTIRLLSHTCGFRVNGSVTVLVKCCFLRELSHITVTVPLPCYSRAYPHGHGSVTATVCPVDIAEAVDLSHYTRCGSAYKRRPVVRSKEVVKRWVNIRDAFNKFLKKEKSLQKSGSEQLKFLTKIFTSRSTEDSLSANCETEKSSELDVLETDNRNNDSQFEIPPRNKPLGSRKRKVDEVDMRILKALEQPEDRHISFFKGIIPSLNTFTEDETLQFQMDVLQVINNIKKRRFQSHQQHPSFNSPSLATTSTATNNYYCYNPPYNTTTEHGRSFREPTVTPPDFSSVNRNIPTHTQTTANYPQQATTRGYFHQYNPIDDNPSSVEIYIYQRPARIVRWGEPNVFRIDSIYSLADAISVTIEPRTTAHHVFVYNTIETGILWKNTKLQICAENNQQTYEKLKKKLDVFHETPNYYTFLDARFANQVGIFRRRLKLLKPSPEDANLVRETRVEKSVVVLCFVENVQFFVSTPKVPVPTPGL